jgi:GTP-binding protein HflX
MSRQRGGSYGSKGSGETQLELDRRGVEARIHIIKQELKKVIKERETMRKRREKTPVPTCALVGYTNAGKSSLLNSLTGADAFVEDRLFATLDPTTRKLQLKDGGSVLLTDTVGFISNLPHTLIDAFKSTLEEASRSDLLLIVLDCSDQNVLSQYEKVMNVLAETGAGEKEKIIVLNKVDKITEDNLILKSLENEFAAAIKVSAKEKTGFLELAETINEKLLGPVKTFKLPLDRSDLVTLIRKTGVLYKEEWLEDHILVEGRLGGVIESSQRTLRLVEEAKL